MALVNDHPHYIVKQNSSSSSEDLISSPEAAYAGRGGASVSSSSTMNSDHQENQGFAFYTAEHNSLMDFNGSSFLNFDHHESFPPPAISCGGGSSGFSFLEGNSMSYGFTDHMEIISPRLIETPGTNQLGQKDWLYSDSTVVTTGSMSTKLASSKIDWAMWSLIAGRLPGRTANDVKNYWNTHLRKNHEHSCKAMTKKRNITSSPTTPVQKIDVLKPRPRSFKVNNSCSHLNGKPEVNVVPPCHGHNNNSITCDKDKEKHYHQLVNELMDGDNMWLESLLEESPKTEATTFTENGQKLAFDVEQLWSLFDEETMELNA